MWQVVPIQIDANGAPYVLTPVDMAVAEAAESVAQDLT
jgi:hypothetical protein